MTNTTQKESIYLSLNENYVSDWTVGNAVRELIQNCIDSGQEFSVEINQITPDSFNLDVTTKNSKLPRESLLLGTTTKSEKDVGSFGEGYKLAMLVLIRAGVKVQIINSNEIWQPHISRSPVFDANVLTIDIETVGINYPVLTYHLSDITALQLQEIEESYLGFQLIKPEHIIRTKYGDILCKAEQEGKIYIEGLFVKKLDFKYGYNLRKEDFKLDRDRRFVDFSAVKWKATEMWLEVGLDKIEFIYSKLIERCTDFVDLRYRTNNTVLVKKLFDKFETDNPGKLPVVAKNDLTFLGYNEVDLVEVSGCLYDLLVYDSRYFEIKKSLNTGNLLTVREAIQKLYNSYETLASKGETFPFEFITEFEQLINNLDNYR